MSLKMIYGRGGSGKTKQIYDEIKRSLAEGKCEKVMLLVPEQYSFRTEQKVLKELGQSSVFKVSILTFNTLVKMILTQVGGATHRLISETGKTMLMTKVMGEVKDELTLFKAVASKPSFIEMAKSLVDEIKRYDVDLGELQRIIEDTEDQELKQKFQDILLFHHAYEEEVHKGYVDLSDEMNFAMERINQADFLKDAEIYIDEFNDFSVVQLKFIEALMVQAKRVIITLTLDRTKSTGDVFQITKDTENKIYHLAEMAGVSIEKPIIIDDETPLRFQGRPELSHLESEYFTYPNKVYEEKVGSIELYKAQNTYDEVEKLALHIKRSVREDETLRYRDLAVLCRNIDGYESILLSVFREHEIPVFLDKRRDLDASSISQYLLGLLEICIQGFTYDALFKLLKTGLSPLTMHEVDVVENYILANGIKAGSFGKKWIYPYPNIREEKLKVAYLEKTNTIREKIEGIYGPLIDHVKKAEDVEQVTRLLYNHLEEHGVFEKDITMINEISDLEIAKEHQEITKGINEIFDNLVDVLGKESLSLEVYGDLVQQAMISLKIALIPLTLDQVILGDVARVKSDHIKGLYILGVNDGVFPKTVSDEGLITDRDISKLKEKGLEIFIDSKTRSIYEQFLVYTAFTIPRDFLRISYVGSDMDGRSQRPSLVIGRLKKLFPKIKEQAYLSPLDEKSGNLDKVEGKKATFNELVKEMRRNFQGEEVNPLWREVYDWFNADADFKERLEVSRNGLEYTNFAMNLSNSSVKALYGDELYLSVSRLERFTACPFAYYIEYGLKAKDRTLHEITAPDVGTLMHDVIDQFTEDLKGLEHDTTKLDRIFIEEQVSRLVDEAILNTNTIYNSSKRFQHMGEKVKRILNRSIETITAQISKGSFVPMFNELGFGKGEKLPALSIEIPDTGEDAFLRGRIDRIDVMELEGKSYLRIIDYKSSAKDVSLKDVFYGLQLQLLVYLDVLMKNWDTILEGEPIPGAVLYFRLDDPMIKGSSAMTDEEIEIKVLESLRLKGLLLNDARVIKSMDRDMEEYSLIIPAKFNKAGDVVSSSNRQEKNKEIILSEEEFTILRDYVRESIGRILKELFDGNISIIPYKDKDKIPCTYCTYKSICQFEPKIENNHYRTLKPMAIDELWENMREKKGGVLIGDQVD